MTTDQAARDAAEAAARTSYGRLLAWLALRWRDLAAAEDALAEAFLAALHTWPRDGVPRSPEAWLMTAAKRNMLKRARHRRMAEDPARQLLLATPEEAPEPFDLPDERLRLMLVCAHPAIEPMLRPALMLQAVLGVEAARIAGVFLVAPEAMAKRLGRAKAKIKAAGIRFETPEARDLPARLDAVLEAIYAAYALDGIHEAHPGAADLAAESAFLAELVASLSPGHPEALGLHALLLFCEARRPARQDAAARFVPLDRQDPARWDAAGLARADALLARAALAQAPGRFQLEAAIQSAHCHRRHGGATPWRDILALYEGLLALAPSTGAQLAHAVALARASGDAAAGLARLDALDPRPPDTHQSWWAVRAHLLEGAGRMAEAAEAYWVARRLTTSPAVLGYLDACLERLAARGH